MSSVTLTSLDPTTGKVNADVPSNTPLEAREAVVAARKVAPEWAALSFGERAGYLKQVRHAIFENLDEIVGTIAKECGKPKAEALGHDVVPTLLALSYVERAAQRALAPESAGRLLGMMSGLSSTVHYRPYGVVGCISPWNYPFFLGFLGLAPALAAGNAVVLKPSEVTPLVGELIRRVLEPLPAGVATVVQGTGDVGAAIIDAPVDKISFIGSPATGRRIAEAAAKHLTPLVMELGGMDAAIVCADADLDLASSGILWGSFLNAGQTCCAVERVYVVDEVADAFTEQILAKLELVKFGGEGAEIGSLTAARQLDVVRRHVTDALAKGARPLAGGEMPEQEGSLWFEPTILEGVTDEMDISSQETFGPVLPIIRVRDEAEAIRRTNEEGFNLTTSVWTRDSNRGERLAASVRAGTITINEHADTPAAPWTPWGGIGESGYGRLNGVWGLREFAVPVHVARNLTPRIKKLWWYPYDDETVRTLRGVAELFSAPSWSEKKQALRTILTNVVPAIRNKY